MSGKTGEINFNPYTANVLDYVGKRLISTTTGESVEIRQDIHWMICGGESGAHARPMNPQWVRWLRDDCLMAGIAFHFKQFGEWAPVSSSDEAFRMVIYGEVKQMHTFDDGHIVYRFGKHKAGRILDGRTWDQFPSVK